MQEHLFEHFNSKGHTGIYRMSLLHLLIKLTSKILKKEKNCWIHTLKTMVPWGLNILNSVNSV